MQHGITLFLVKHDEEEEKQKAAERLKLLAEAKERKLKE
jgi:hypothetical protein